MSLRNNNSNARKISKMTPEDRHAYFISGRVSIDHVDQLVKNADGKNVLKRFYVAKIRGVIVGNRGETLHETPEAAKAHGQRILDLWRGQS
jgi:hypothetical protein